jgi:hypothetical protein
LIYSLKINKINKIKVIIWGLGIGDWGMGPIQNPQSPCDKKYIFQEIFIIKN